MQNFAAEKQRCAAQWHHKAHPGHAGQEYSPPCGVFDGKTARHPIAAAVVVIQSALQACNIVWSLLETGNNLLNLIRLWRILGIPNPDDTAAAEVQGVVQGPRFGFQKVGFWHFNYADPIRQFGSVDGVTGNRVASLKHQNYLQKRFRIG